MLFSNIISYDVDTILFINKIRFIVKINVDYENEKKNGV